MTRILLSPPDVRGRERAAVIEAIDSGWIAPIGPALDAFEVALAAATGRAHAVALSSGSAALHLALHEMGVGAGDDVLVSTFTFAASAFPVLMCGARPVFIDSGLDSWNVSTSLLLDELESRRKAGTAMPAAAVIVDIYGVCAGYDRIVPVLEHFGVPLLEDATEALGSSDGRALGGAHGTAAALSFNGNKVITSSGGGALVCDDATAAARYRHLASQAREPAVHYEHRELGFNYRLSNLLAAFGHGQLVDLDARISRRRAIRDAYEVAFDGIDGIAFQPTPVGHRPNHWLTCITLDPGPTGLTPDQLRLTLDAAEIESRPVWKPLHLQPVFADAPCRLDGTSEMLFERGLCLPSGSGMSDADLGRVIDVVLDAATAR